MTAPNMLTLIKALDRRDKHGHRYGLYKCECGDEKEIVMNSAKSCGCLRKPMKKGDKFNKLTFIKNLDKGHGLFECECGNKERIDKHNVKKGETKSCGCLMKFKYYKTTVDGQELNLSDAAKLLGCSVQTLSARINRLGWTLEKAISEPIQKREEKKE